MVLTNLSKQDNYNIPISDWLSNRTLRNFLSNHSESTWPEVVKIIALLGVFTLNYKSEDGENTRWGHDDLRCLVDYIQKEKQWPEESTNFCFDTLLHRYKNSFFLPGPSRQRPEARRGEKLKPNCFCIAVVFVSLSRNENN